MTDSPVMRARGTGRRVIVTALGLFLAGVLLQWAWNGIAVELFGAPSSRFRHALAFAGALLACGGLLGAGLRLALPGIPGSLPHGPASQR